MFYVSLSMYSSFINFSIKDFIWQMFVWNCGYSIYTCTTRSLTFISLFFFIIRTIDASMAKS